MFGCTTQDTLAPYRQISTSKNSYKSADKKSTLRRKTHFKAQGIAHPISKVDKIPIEKNSFVVVQKKDTLYAISKNNDVPLRDLIETNNLSPPYQLKIGQKIYLPQKNTHIVQKGETLYSISRDYGVDQSRLAHENHLSPPWVLSVHQKLLLPGRVHKTQNTAPIAVPIYKISPQDKAARDALTKKNPVARSSSKFLRPIEGTLISHYGPKKKGLQNDGINIQAPRGTPIKSTENGVVVYKGTGIESFGQLILIKHADGWVSAYGHTEAAKVEKGDHVKRGQIIAAVGMSGRNIKIPQLHFELRHKTRTVNPEKYI